MKRRLTYCAIGFFFIITMLTACNHLISPNQNANNITSNQVHQTSFEILPEENGYVAESSHVPPLDEEEGKVLNIWCMNDGLSQMFEEKYPGYVEIDYETGMIGDVKICWTHNIDDSYQEDLERRLYDNDYQEDNEKIDLYVIGDQDIQRYMKEGYALPLTEVGITQEDLSMQYAYTHNNASDAGGKVYGFSYNAAPGAFWYRRDIALEVLGTDEPEMVQQYITDWGSFYDTAGMMKEAGYYMTQDMDLLFKAFSSERELPWIVNNKFKYDENTLAWAMFSKELYNKEYIKDAYILADEECTDVFGYFAPLWFKEGLHDYKFEDGWGVCVPPENFYYAENYICVAPDTDNVALVREILVTMATDENILKYFAESGLFGNNKEIMREMANNEAYCSDMFDGQNVYAVFCDVAENTKAGALCEYEVACEEEFKSAMYLYIRGEYTYAEAMRQYELALKEKYPELKQ